MYKIHCGRHLLVNLVAPRVQGQLLVDGSSFSTHARLANALIHVHGAIVNLHHCGANIMSFDSEFTHARLHYRLVATQLSGHGLVVDGHYNVAAAEARKVGLALTPRLRIAK